MQCGDLSSMILGAGCCGEVSALDGDLRGAVMLDGIGP